MKDKLKKIWDSVAAFFRALPEKIGGAFRKIRFHRPTAKTWIKTASLFAGLIVAAVAAIFIVSGAMCGSVSDSIREPKSGETADCIIVLGALVHEDGTPSNMLRDRLEVGIRLYSEGKAGKILMSGDSEKDGYDEVGAMKKYAVDAGVPEDDIICDIYGLSTYDSMWRAKNVYGMKSVMISTQKYHLYRAVYIAEKLGLKTCGVSADLRTYSGQVWRDVREIGARFKDYFQVQAEGKPVYTE